MNTQLINEFKTLRSELRSKLQIDSIPLNGMTAIMGLLNLVRISLLNDKIIASMGGMETEVDISLFDEEILSDIVLVMRNYLQMAQ